MLSVLLLPLAALASGADPALAAEGWELDWEKWCIFKETESEHPEYLRQPQPCSAYVRVMKVRADDGSEYQEREYMWRRPDGREVRYVAKVGGLGVSIATIGVVSDNRYDGGARFDPAVTYAAHRNHMVIAVPGEGYEFAVCDFDPGEDRC